MNSSCPISVHANLNKDTLKVFWFYRQAISKEMLCVKPTREMILQRAKYFRTESLDIRPGGVWPPTLNRTSALLKRLNWLSLMVLMPTRFLNSAGNQFSQTFQTLLRTFWLTGLTAVVILHWSWSRCKLGAELLSTWIFTNPLRWRSSLAKSGDVDGHLFGPGSPVQNIWNIKSKWERTVRVMKAEAPYFWETALFRNCWASDWTDESNIWKQSTSLAVSLWK